MSGVNPAAFGRQRRQKPEATRKRADEPRTPEVPPVVYEGRPRDWFTDEQTQRAAMTAHMRCLASEDDRVRLRAVEVFYDRAWGKPRAEGDVLEGVRTGAPRNLASAQDALEEVLGHLVGDLQERVRKGARGAALVTEAEKGARVLEELLARRKEASAMAGLQGASAADLVQRLAEQMPPAELAALRQNLARLAEAKGDVQ
ncbi:MAG TPA: hypothetical protein VFY89_08925 [Ktedonobacterales bacterium]